MSPSASAELKLEVEKLRAAQTSAQGVLPERERLFQQEIAGLRSKLTQRERENLENQRSALTRCFTVTHWRSFIKPSRIARIRNNKEGCVHISTERLSNAQLMSAVGLKVCLHRRDIVFLNYLLVCSPGPGLVVFFHKLARPTLSYFWHKEEHNILTDITAPK